MSTNAEPVSGIDILYHKLKMFPHCTHNLEITLVKHFEQNCIEVIAYDHFVNKEANRVYVSARKVSYAAEFEYRETQQDFDIDCRKMINSLTCDFIMNRLHFVQRKNSEFIIFLSSEVCTTEASLGAKNELSLFPSFQFVDKPDGLIPHKIHRSIRAAAVANDVKLNININRFSTYSTDSADGVFRPSDEEQQERRRFKMSPNSAFTILLKKSPDSVVEICEDSDRNSGPPLIITKKAVPNTTTIAESSATANNIEKLTKVSSKRRSFDAVREFAARAMAPLFSLHHRTNSSDLTGSTKGNNTATATNAAAAPSAPATKEVSPKARLLSLNIFQKKKATLPPLETKKQSPEQSKNNTFRKAQAQQKELSVTVVGSSYVPNPVAHEAPEGVHRPLPQQLSPLTPSDVRKQKLYHRKVISNLQIKTDV